ncbi:amino acid adenylation domain-containing protein [Sorangium sp. So ce291]|uniref:non-ribosomal peptide synthetase n=1 Tax=Sorangium sp. So ce291 TaxID=3133294 RepID=UPI003F607DF9
MSSSNTARSEALVEGFELSPEQARLWRWQEAHLARAARAAELRLRVPADADEARLRQSLAQVIDRHEILRTDYRNLPGMALPVQVIQPSAAIRWGAPDRDGADGGVAVTLDGSGAGLSVRLRLPAAHTDTAGLLRLAAAWAAAYRGEAPEEPALQYADYAAWRHEIRGTDPRAHEFWEGSLAARAAATALPLRGQPHAGAARVEPGRFRLPVPPGLEDLWTRQARALGVRPAMLALAAWVTLFHQHGDADQLTVGLDWQERSGHLGDAMGLFGGPLPLTVGALGTSSVEALCRALHARCAELVEWRDYFPDAADEDPYAVGFRYVPADGEAALAALTAASWRVEAADSPTAPHHLLLEVQEGGGAPGLVLHASRALYDDAAAALIGEQLLTLLEDACRDPARRPRELSALSAAERRLVTEVLSRSDPLPDDRERELARVAALPHLAACFEEQIRRHPGRPAVAGAAGGLTYAELDARAARLAQGLLARGVAPGTRVAHFLPRDVDAVVAMLAILRAGAVYVPIDPDYPAARIAYLLDDCGADLALTRRDLAAMLPERWQDASRLLFTDGAPAEDHAARPWPEIRPDHTAYIIYTSGSTGQPRGVPITHANALYSVAARVAYYPDPIGRFLLLSSFAFDSSIAGLFGTLAQGGCLRVCSEVEQKDPGRLADIVRGEGITHLLALPSLYQLLLHRLAGQPLALTTAIVAGEACPRALVDAHHRALPGARLYNEYGATEASVWSTVGACGPSPHGGPVTIGRPIPHSRVYALDDAGRPVARGIKGEICVGGPGLSPGYLHRPELTREKFVEIAGERLYRTGDHAFWDERGELVFLGRGDGQVKIRGYRVELGEVEAALRRATGAEQVVVLADRGDDGQVFLRGFVEAAQPLEVAAVRNDLARLLPDPMIPADIQALPALPRTANGKFDRRALLALRRLRQRAPYAPPSGDVERALAALWEELLAIDLVGRDDDFFALGGHSLLAVRLVHQIGATFHVELPVRAVFQNPRLEALAARLEAEMPAPGAPAPGGGTGAPAPRSSLVPLRAGGSRPPLFCVDPTGVHVAAYEPLAGALGGDRPVIGLELGPALAEEGASVRRIAERLARAIREHQPRGPYHLVGWSVAGVLALGVAWALEEQGEQVAFLGILDTQPPARLHAAGQPDAVEELAEQVHPDRRADLYALPPPELRALRERLEAFDDDARVREAVAWAQARGLLPRDAQPAALEGRYALLRDAAGFMRELLPRGLRAAIHVWWSAETLTRRGGPPIDWQAYTRGPVHAATLAGDHLAAVQGGEVHAHLREILSALADADAASSGEQPASTEGA